MIVLSIMFMNVIFILFLSYGFFSIPFLLSPLISCCSIYFSLWLSRSIFPCSLYIIYSSFTLLRIIIYIFYCCVWNYSIQIFPTLLIVLPQILKGIKGWMILCRIPYFVRTFIQTKGYHCNTYYSFRIEEKNSILNPGL